MTRLRSVLCHLFGAMCGLTITFTAWLVLDRRDPVILEHGELIPNEVRNGDRAIIVWHITELRLCAGDLRRVIIDSSNKVHEFAKEATVYHDLVVKGSRTFSKNFTMPYGMAPGPANYYGIGTRWCNVLQQNIWPIFFRSPAVPFTILPDHVKPRGERGPSGYRGETGRRGEQGIDGEQGPVGEPGPER